MYRDREVNVGTASAIGLVQIGTKDTERVIAFASGVKICTIPTSTRRAFAG